MLFHLECEGVVTKKILQEVPPKVEYRLTPQAKEV
ncbi:MAG: winged helix-turn-helix transcriptional regulator [Nitrososphaeraceae archaeon]